MKTNNQKIKIEITHEQIREKVKKYLSSRKNLDIVDGFYLALGFNTFYEYCEFLIKHQLVTLNEVALMIVQYYGNDYTKEEKQEFLINLQ